MKKYIMIFIFVSGMAWSINLEILTDEVGVLFTDDGRKFDLEFKTEQFSSKVDISAIKIFCDKDSFINRTRELKPIGVTETNTRRFLKLSYRFTKRFASYFKYGFGQTTLNYDGLKFAKRNDKNLPTRTYTEDNIGGGSITSNWNGKYRGIGLRGIIYQEGDFSIDLDFQFGSQTTTDLGVLYKYDSRNNPAGTYETHNFDVAKAETQTLQLACTLNKRFNNIYLFSGIKLFDITTNYYVNYQGSDSAWSGSYTDRDTMRHDEPDWIDRLGFIGGARFILTDNTNTGLDVDITTEDIGFAWSFAYKF